MTAADSRGEWVDAQVKAGHYVTGGNLDTSITASTVRKPHGDTVVVDGPFSEAREQIGGFHVIECKDRAAALAVAETIPTLPAGGTIEVREQLYQLGS